MNVTYLSSIFVFVVVEERFADDRDKIQSFSDSKHKRMKKKQTKTDDFVKTTRLFPFKSFLKFEKKKKCNDLC